MTIAPAPRLAHHAPQPTSPSAPSPEATSPQSPSSQSTPPEPLPLNHLDALSRFAHGEFTLLELSIEIDRHIVDTVLWLASPPVAEMLSGLHLALERKLQAVALRQKAIALQLLGNIAGGDAKPDKTRHKALIDILRLNPLHLRVTPTNCRTARPVPDTQKRKTPPPESGTPSRLCSCDGDSRIHPENRLADGSDAEDFAELPTNTPPEFTPGGTAPAGSSSPNLRMKNTPGSQTVKNFQTPRPLPNPPPRLLADRVALTLVSGYQ